MSDLSSNVRRGLWWGVAFAALYSVVVVAIVVVRGASPFDANGVSLPGVLVLYWLAGLGGGLVYGLLLPLGRSRLGAMFLGFVVALPVAGAASLFVESTSHVARPILVVSFAAVMGPLAGAFLWNQARRGL